MQSVCTYVCMCTHHTHKLMNIKNKSNYDLGCNILQEKVTFKRVTTQYSTGFFFLYYKTANYSAKKL